MHFASSIPALLLAAMASATNVQLAHFEAEGCSGDPAGSDISGSDVPIHYCFNFSESKSFRWTKIYNNAAGDSYAKFTYYADTECEGDVTAVKSLCGIPSKHGTCYDKHDPNAGSVFVQTMDGHDCSIFDEGEIECEATDSGVTNPVCSEETHTEFPDSPDFGEGGF